MLARGSAGSEKGGDDIAKQTAHLLETAQSGSVLILHRIRIARVVAAQSIEPMTHAGQDGRAEAEHRKIVLCNDNVFDKLLIRHSKIRQVLPNKRRSGKSKTKNVALQTKLKIKTKITSGNVKWPSPNILQTLGVDEER